jgi:hypothetical protein|tara:strand:+ start:3531 stop:4349 length:819 start_codon:yes stop_codon:yes gene_type:complete
MTHKSFKKEKINYKQRLIDKKRLIKPFIKLYKNPILVHAIDEKIIFKNILKEGKLKLPKKHSFPKKTPFMEEILNIDNGIYYTLGFVYLIAYDWKYNLIFDINYLKNCIYYKQGANYQCYKAVVDYWYKEDKKYLERLANKNKICRKIVNKYYNKKYGGKKRMLFDFWKIEKYVFDHINKYPNKKEIIKVIKKTEQKLIKNFPSSLRDAKKSYLQSPEIVGLNEINLLKNKYFLGFHINGNIPKDVMAILKKKYSNKILFDGEKIKIIGKLI